MQSLMEKALYENYCITLVVFSAYYSLLHRIAEILLALILFVIIIRI